MKTLVFLLTILIASVAYGADKQLNWDAAAGATGYKIYMSIDNAVTWDAGIDVGNVTTYLYTNIPDTGVVLFRFSAYNVNGEAIRYDSMVAHCGDCGPPQAVPGVGIQ